jgi:hypothetical protein
VTVALKSRATGADAPSVSDLSRLLEDVYGDPSADVDAPPSARQAAPGLSDWPADGSLDDATEAWFAGQPTGVERGSSDDADATGPHQLVSAVGSTRAWSRQDDDILPSRGGKHARRKGSAATDAHGPVTGPTMAVLTTVGPAPTRRGRLRRR